MKKFLLHTLFLVLTATTSISQKIVLDAGHGWGAPLSGGGCANPDTRLVIEMEASHSVSHKLKDKFTQECSNAEILLTRPSNECNGWVSLSQRTTMANSWGADALLSIHTNAGGGTGTESFWCSVSPSVDVDDQIYCNTIQNNVVSYTNSVDRRSVEDDSYLNFHLYILRYSNTTSVLNEMGFGDNTNDYVKLSDDAWRNMITNAFYESLKSHLNIPCVTSDANPLGSCGNPIQLLCGSSYLGTTIDGQSNFDSYGCDTTKPEYGKEKVHTFTVGRTSNVEISLSGLTTDIDVHLSSDCTKESCIARNDNIILYDSLPDGVYYVITDGYGSSNPAEGEYTLDIKCTPVSIGTGDYFEVYPNPFEDNFRITALQNKSKQVSYKLYDSAGNLINEGVFINYIKLYINDLRQGMYFLHITDNKTTKVKKLVKK
jgi:N-acetylmuramoyl-L-alanine amidase